MFPRLFGCPALPLLSLRENRTIEWVSCVAVRCRDTMSTLMLEIGADIRFIQQMLGHAHRSTTEI